MMAKMNIFSLLLFILKFNGLLIHVTAQGPNSKSRNKTIATNITQTIYFVYYFFIVSSSCTYFVNLNTRYTILSFRISHLFAQGCDAADPAMNRSHMKL